MLSVLSFKTIFLGNAHTVITNKLQKCMSQINGDIVPSSLYRKIQFRLGIVLTNVGNPCLARQSQILLVGLWSGEQAGQGIVQINQINLHGIQLRVSSAEWSGTLSFWKVMTLSICTWYEIDEIKNSFNVLQYASTFCHLLKKCILLPYREKVP